MRRMRLAAVVLAFGCTTGSAHEVKLEHLQLVHPWARGQATAGPTAPRDVNVYMAVFNRGAYADRLIAVSSPLAAAAEVRDGEQPRDALALEAKSSLKMGIDGPHVVLRGVTDDLAGYEAFPVWLTFERAGRVEVAVVVEDAAVKEPTCSGSLMPSEMPKAGHPSGHDHHTP
jgi:periplasmic copper chaperone A